MEQIPLENLIVDFTIYPRNEVSSQTVTGLVDALECGDELPPITVCKKTNRVVDGVHRLEAHKRLKHETISAILKTYKSEAELFAEAVRLNRGHGRALDSYDIKKAIARLGEYGYSKEQIGEIVRVPLAKVEDTTRGFAVAQKGGESIPLKNGLHQFAGERITKQQQQVVEHYSGMEGAYHARQLIMLLDADMWKRTPQFIEAMDRLTVLWNDIQAREIT